MFMNGVTHFYRMKIFYPIIRQTVVEKYFDATSHLIVYLALNNTVNV